MAYGEENNFPIHPVHGKTYENTSIIRQILQQKLINSKKSTTVDVITTGNTWTQPENSTSFKLKVIQASATTDVIIDSKNLGYQDLTLEFENVKEKEITVSGTGIVVVTYK